MADANKFVGQNMEEKSSHELLRVKGHDFLLILISVIVIPKMDVIIFNFDESMIGDSDSVGILAEVAHDLFGPREGFFSVDDPRSIGSLVEKIYETSLLR